MISGRRHFLLACALSFASACLHTRGKPGPQAGERVPELSLPGDDGKRYSLHELLETRQPVVLVFYRGHW